MEQLELAKVLLGERVQIPESGFYSLLSHLYSFLSVEKYLTSLKFSLFICEEEIPRKLSSPIES